MATIQGKSQRNVLDQRSFRCAVHSDSVDVYCCAFKRVCHVNDTAVCLARRTCQVPPKTKGSWSVVGAAAQSVHVSDDFQPVLYVSSVSSTMTSRTIPAEPKAGSKRACHGCGHVSTRLSSVHTCWAHICGTNKGTKDMMYISTRLA